MENFKAIKKKYPNGFKMFDLMISSQSFKELMDDFEPVIQGEDISESDMKDLFERAEMFALRLRK